jgi:hypothetical protein
VFAAKVRKWAACREWSLGPALGSSPQGDSLSLTASSYGGGGVVLLTVASRAQRALTIFRLYDSPTTGPRLTWWGPFLSATRQAVRKHSRFPD